MYGPGSSAGQLLGLATGLPGLGHHPVEAGELLLRGVLRLLRTTDVRGDADQRGVDEGGSRVLGPRGAPGQQPGVVGRGLVLEDSRRAGSAPASPGPPRRGSRRPPASSRTGRWRVSPRRAGRGQRRARCRARRPVRGRAPRRPSPGRTSGSGARGAPRGRRRTRLPRTPSSSSAPSARSTRRERSPAGVSVVPRGFRSNPWCGKGGVGEPEYDLPQVGAATWSVSGPETAAEQAPHRG